MSLPLLKLSACLNATARLCALLSVVHRVQFMQAWLPGESLSEEGVAAVTSSVLCMFCTGVLHQE